MYDNPTYYLNMFDDGAHGDGQAGDGVYGASIPAGSSSPGEMIRYYIRAYDTQGGENRLPLPLDTVGVNQSLDAEVIVCIHNQIDNLCFLDFTKYLATGVFNDKFKTKIILHYSDMFDHGF